MNNEREELAAINDKHWIYDSKNLGQYRTKFTCLCGAEVVHDGHNLAGPSAEREFELHIADMILAAGYTKAPR